MKKQEELISYEMIRKLLFLSGRPDIRFLNNTTIDLSLLEATENKYPPQVDDKIMVEFFCVSLKPKVAYVKIDGLKCYIGLADDNSLVSGQSDNWAKVLKEFCPIKYNRFMREEIKKRLEYKNKDIDDLYKDRKESIDNFDKLEKEYIAERKKLQQELKKLETESGIE